MAKRYRIRTLPASRPPRKCGGFSGSAARPEERGELPARRQRDPLAVADAGEHLHGGRPRLEPQRLVEGAPWGLQSPGTPPRAGSWAAARGRASSPRGGGGGRPTPPAPRRAARPWRWRSTPSPGPSRPAPPPPGGRSSSPGPPGRGASPRSPPRADERRGARGSSRRSLPGAGRSRSRPPISSRTVSPQVRAVRTSTAKPSIARSERDADRPGSRVPPTTTAGGKGVARRAARSEGGTARG